MNAYGLIEGIRHRLWKCAEPLLLVLVVYTPWAFNSHPPPFSQILHLLVMLFAVVAMLGKPPVSVPSFGTTLLGKLFITSIFLFLTYVLISFLNARATAFVGGAGVGLRYFEAILWLPHSYSRQATQHEWYWQVALCGAFFGVCRWIRAQAVQRSLMGGSSHWTSGIRKLLWVLSISSGLMAIEAIIQRLSHSNYLLFIYPRYTWRYVLDGNDSLGPFSYQGSGAAYFNFIWPLTFGLWCTNQLREYRRSGVRPRFGTHLSSILPAASLLMMVSVFTTTSRAGAVVCLLQMCAIALIAWANRKAFPQFLTISVVFAGLLATATIVLVGVGPILKKIEHARLDEWGGRLPVYRQVLKMIPDFDPWGGGAGSFPALSDLYTDPSVDSWESMVHNDWLEARFSYGKIGFGILVASVVLGFLYARNNQFRVIPRTFVPFLWIALIGFCVDAFVDIPFQTRSLHLFFALGCAIALYATPNSANTTPETF